MRGDKQQRDEFIEANLGLVHSLAGRFRGRGVDYEELCAAGSLGLIKAYDRFDEDRGLCFSTYAVPVILGEIKKLFRDGGTVKVSRSLKELSIKINHLRASYIAKNGVEPTVTIIAEQLGCSVNNVTEAICAAQPALSLSPIYDDDNDSREMDIPIQNEESVIEDRIAVREALSRITPQQRELITLRYFKGKTQSETAKILGTTQVQISRMERKILAKMREDFT